MAAGATGVAASRADAFVGEGSVLDPVKKALTPAAETVVKQGKFIPETVLKAGAAGGVGAAGQAAGVFQAGSVLPVLGSVLAFGVGAGIGSEICHVIGIEGCWFYGSEGADVSPAAKWSYASKSWEYTFGGTTIKGDAFQFVYSTSTGLNGAPVGTASVSTEHCAFGDFGRTAFFGTGKTEACPGYPAEVREIGVSARSSMENRTLDYHATDNPAIGNYSYSAPSNWSNKMYDALVGAGGEAGKVGEEIASSIPGSEVPSPYALEVVIPDCDGLLYAACEELLEERGLKVTRVTRTWETADTDAEPDEVLELDPSKATEVEKGTTVTVTTNPDEAGMPIVIPEPGARETYDEYAAKLNPGLTPERKDLTEAYIDPARGPDEVVSTTPGPGTRVNPTTGAEVTVRTNPAEAPAPGTAGWTAPAIPALDLTPLTEVSVGCNTFPFGVFCWLQDGLSGWSSSGTCPEIDVPLGTSVSAENELPFDLCQFEPAMEIIRPVLVLVATLGLGMMFAYAALGIGGSGSGDD